MNIFEQPEPCPKCKQLAGWWSPLRRTSMVIHAATGEKLEHRLYESHTKYCMNCNTEITTLFQ